MLASVECTETCFEFVFLYCLAAVESKNLAFNICAVKFSTLKCFDECDGLSVNGERSVSGGWTFAQRQGVPGALENQVSRDLQ